MNLTNRIRTLSAVILGVAILAGCSTESQQSKDAAAVERQQGQYAAAQPIPAYDWSLERSLLIQLYNARNMRAATHSVWRSNTGLVEGDCPSMGYGLPYDTSLTNPIGGSVYDPPGQSISRQIMSVEQPEPNGIFASKNTSATWVFCVGPSGSLEPIYVESKVTAYPYPLVVDYDKNRVSRKAGAASTVNLQATQ